MIDKIIYKLNVNPFLNGLIFQAFYYGYGKKECPLLLHNIILPLILNGSTRKTLMYINRTQDITDFVSKSKLDLINLQETIWKLRESTNDALIVLDNNREIELNSLVIVNKDINFNHYNNDLKQYLRPATNLGLLFKDESIGYIYKTFNVIP